MVPVALATSFPGRRAERFEQLAQDIHTTISSSRNAPSDLGPFPGISCSGSAPFAGFTCITGYWVWPSNLTLNASLTIPADSQILINGNLELNYRADIRFMGLKSRLDIDKCLLTGGYKHSVIFNLTKTSPPTGVTGSIPFIQINSKCNNTLTKLSLSVVDGPYCRLTSVHSHSARNDSLMVSFQSSKLNCVIIYSIIGTVAGLLATTVAISIASLFWMRRNRAESYSKGFDREDDSPPPPEKVEIGI